MPRLDSKVALITGATGGIGEASAKRFLEEGANVMLVGRSEEKLQTSVERLNGGKAVSSYVADAADEIALAAAIQATIDSYGHLDILFANAGIEGDSKPLEEQSRELFENILQTNVIGVWLAMKLCVGAMKAQRSGSIIATSSAAGLIGFPGVSPYVASKHAVCGLVKTAALELGDFNIRVNAIAPGPIDNRMIKSLEEQMNPEDSAAVRTAIEQSIALKRYGTNEEVANLALFLASDESSYCTGVVHSIDGGYVAA
jgi:NAD(P)-dependent dehydrogenase (short-subunit alcohol dehydrogenase family)